MKKLIIPAMLFVALLFMFLASCGKATDTTEACRHETMMNLDKGNYDAVLASTCADAMQIGAAWFGKAGFDMTNVINRFIDANDANQPNSDLNIYMNSLTGHVTSNTINYLDNAKTSYNGVPDTEPGYRDAQFYSSLVDTLNALSILKLGIQDASGSIDESCDLNNNGQADGIDATACALMLSYGQTCASIATNPTITYITVPDFIITKVDGMTDYPEMFTGLIITTGTVTTGTDPSCTGKYTKVQYTDAMSPSGLSLATVTQDKCTGTKDNPEDLQGLWPCPIDNPNYLDFVKATDESLTTAMTSMDNSLVGDMGGVAPDVQQSINDIKAEACCTDEPIGTDPTNCSCSSAELADYLQSIYL